MEDDWDLHAVVRGCAAASSAANTANSRDCNSLSQDPFEPRRERAEELRELYQPLFPQDSSQLLFSLPFSPLPAATAAAAEQTVVKQSPPPVGQKQPCFSVSDVSRSHNSIPRSKRRKNHLKRVCHVAAENLSSDMWSWRKYGQKPIKGSPYPRGYYRCSTLKGCMARKQVERNRSDPGMFIVTYTAEHNHPVPTHRNSLAGSTRHKPPTSDDPTKSSSSPEMSAVAPLEKLETREDLGEDDDQGPCHMQGTSSGSAPDDDDDLSISKMAMDDDFFSGLEDFTGDGGDCTSGQFPATLQFPWASSGGATTISDGG